MQLERLMLLGSLQRFLRQKHQMKLFNCGTQDGNWKKFLVQTCMRSACFWIIETWFEFVCTGDIDSHSATSAALVAMIEHQSCESWANKLSVLWEGDKLCDRETVSGTRMRLTTLQPFAAGRSTCFLKEQVTKRTHAQKSPHPRDSRMFLVRICGRSTTYRGAFRWSSELDVLTSQVSSVFTSYFFSGEQCEVEGIDSTFQCGWDLGLASRSQKQCVGKNKNGRKCSRSNFVALVLFCSFLFVCTIARKLCAKPSRGTNICFALPMTEGTRTFLEIIIRTDRLHPLPVAASFWSHGFFCTRHVQNLKDWNYLQRGEGHFSSTFSSQTPLVSHCGKQMFKEVLLDQSARHGQPLDHLHPIAWFVWDRCCVWIPEVVCWRSDKLRPPKKRATPRANSNARGWSTHKIITAATTWRLQREGASFWGSLCADGVCSFVGVAAVCQSLISCAGRSHLAQILASIADLDYLQLHRSKDQIHSYMSHWAMTNCSRTGYRIDLAFKVIVLVVGRIAWAHVWVKRKSGTVLCPLRELSVKFGLKTRQVLARTVHMKKKPGNLQAKSGCRTHPGSAVKSFVVPCAHLPEDVTYHLDGTCFPWVAAVNSYQTRKNRILPVQTPR